MTPSRGPGSTFGWSQIVNALIWALTILGSGAVVKAPGNVSCLPLVLITGSVASRAAIRGTSTHSRTTSPLSR